MKKKLLYLCILCLFCTMLFAGCKNKKNNTSNNPNYDTENYLTGKHYVKMEVDGFGDIVLELDADAAPATVTNFIDLVSSSFYNGLTFHRIIPGFMIQGGDPEGTGLGGSEHTLPGEFSENGFDNPISHVRGTISMARAEDYDSASSQFFIVHQDATELDGKYAAFGTVLYGMNVVDDLCNYIETQDANGTVAQEDQPVINHIVILGEEAITLMRHEYLASLPASDAKISFAPISSTEGLDLADTWNIHEDGETYILFSDKPLAEIGIYHTDVNTGMDYDEASLLGGGSNLDANQFISVKLNIPKEGMSDLLLVIVEPIGAASHYLICYDEYFGGAYLVPVMY